MAYNVKKMADKHTAYLKFDTPYKIKGNVDIDSLSVYCLSPYGYELESVKYKIENGKFIVPYPERFKKLQFKVGSKIQYITKCAVHYFLKGDMSS